MKKLIINLLSVSIILIATSGCTLCRQSMMDEAATDLRVAGYVRSPENKLVWLSGRAAAVMAKNDPIAAIALGIDPYASTELSSAQIYVQQQFFQKYNVNPAGPALNVGELCWQNHPIKWPLAVAVDKAVPPTLAACTVGGIAWGISEINTGGGSDSDGKTDTTITGDNNEVTIYNTDGDVGVDSHDYEGSSE